METICGKRKRTGDAGQHEQATAAGMQEVPFPGWIDLSASSRDSPLPPGWEQCLDLQSGKMYYVNVATQTRVLEVPRMLSKDQDMIGKGESLGLDLEMRLPSLASMQSKASMVASPLMLFKDTPNHCNSVRCSNASCDVAATSPGFPTAPFNTNLPVAATNMISSMAATVCIYCHTFVMVSRQSPHCPNCKNVCSMDPPIPLGK